MDRGPTCIKWATVLGVAMSQRHLSDFTQVVRQREREASLPYLSVLFRSSADEMMPIKVSEVNSPSLEAVVNNKERSCNVSNCGTTAQKPDMRKMPGL